MLILNKQVVDRVTILQNHWYVQTQYVLYIKYYSPYYDHFKGCILGYFF